MTTDNIIGKYVKYIPLAYLITFYLLPILIWIWGNFETLSAYELINPPFRKAFGVTLLISLITAGASMMLAYPIALCWWIFKSRKAAKYITFFMILPIVIGLLIRNYSWLGILSYTDIEFSFEAVLLVMVYIYIPFSYFILLQGFKNIPINIIDAAKIMGATMTESFFRLILPLTYRQIFISFTLTFTNCLLYYITPEMIGGGKFDMIANIILRNVDHGLFGSASRIAMILLIYMAIAFSIIFYLIYRYRKNLIIFKND